MTVAEKKTFWGKRRVAVGGRTLPDGESDAESDGEEAADVAEEDEMELPDVGGGRGTAKGLPPHTLQPIVYHEFPVNFWEGVLHAVSGTTVIDLTPQAGRFAAWCVTNHVGYVGVTQNDIQKAYIGQQVLDAVLKAQADPKSKLYSPGKQKGKRPAEVEPEDDDGKGEAAEDHEDPGKPKPEGKPPDPKKKPRKTPKAKIGPSEGKEAEEGDGGNEGLSPALAAMLRAAKEAAAADGEGGGE